MSLALYSHQSEPLKLPTPPPDNGLLGGEIKSMARSLPGSASRSQPLELQQIQNYQWFSELELLAQLSSLIPPAIQSSVTTPGPATTGILTPGPSPTPLPVPKFPSPTPTPSRSSTFLAPPPSPLPILTPAHTVVSPLSTPSAALDEPHPSQMESQPRRSKRKRKSSCAAETGAAALSAAGDPPSFSRSKRTSRRKRTSSSSPSTFSLSDLQLPAQDKRVGVRAYEEYAPPLEHRLDGLYARIEIAYTSAHARALERSMLPGLDDWDAFGEEVEAWVGPRPREEEAPIGVEMQEAKEGEEDREGKEGEVPGDVVMEDEPEGAQET